MGILSSRREGKSIYYRISDDRVRKLISEEYSKWMILDREDIEWYPEIDMQRCNGCGLCVLGCDRRVFDYTDGMPAVKHPINCRVGCKACEVYCLQNAISFPDDEYVKKIIRENNLFEWSKKQLERYRGD
jgi:NAD-dependent dihydropyrimidine dehydrogenase PreA subunit